jgi:NAD(P) transhydrogenase subunit alpha
MTVLADIGVSNATLAEGLFVFALAAFLGFVLISKVPATLHTPLMSGTNAIHGIVLVGALVIAAAAHDAVGDIIAVIAVFLGTMNVVGGFVVTDRMLEMFRKRTPPPASGAAGDRDADKPR